MSDRLTDAELAELRSFADAFLPSRAWHLLDRLVEELRERRAADLTDAHLDGLRFCIDNVWDDAEGRHPEFVKLAREVLSKLGGGR